MASIFAYIFLCVAGVLTAVAIVLLSYTDKLARFLYFARSTSIFTSFALIAASGILLGSLANSDFSLEYVVSYSERSMPIFYKLTAFWAGQEGSMLLWALISSICVSTFAMSRIYDSLSMRTQMWYQIFSLSIIGFFILLIVAYSNPFILSHRIPMDGNGLNPLLRNPGMIFHPPLLFLGYGIFIVPACLALAQIASGERVSAEKTWIVATKPYIMYAWATLTAGIALGAWWAYMELGWGGYWAWDPVENASLVPWLIATATLHLCSIERRRGILQSINAFLMALVVISTFFATWIVRSGVIQSVHAFGDGGVGTPLLLFSALSFIIITIVATSKSSDSKIKESNELESLTSREGFIVISSLLMILTSAIILLATLWPAITGIFGVSKGLNVGFYTMVCVPIFVAMIALLAICPWMKWTGGIIANKYSASVLIVFIAMIACMWFLGYRNIVAMLASSSGFAILAGTITYVYRNGKTKTLPTILLHASVGVLAIGIAFSAAFKEEYNFVIKTNESKAMGKYTASLQKIDFGEGINYIYARAIINIAKDGVQICTLRPERQIYDKWRGMPAAEADTHFSLRSEIYASLIGVDDQNTAHIRISFHPLVNWIWIASILLSIIPLFVRIPKTSDKKAVSNTDKKKKKA